MTVYHLDGDARNRCEILRWPFGLLLALLSASAIFRRSPRRRQPGYTWLAFGAAVYLVLWTALTWLLPVASVVLDTIYGPLSAFMSLLLGLPDLHRPLSGALLRRAVGGRAGAAARSDHSRPGSSSPCATSQRLDSRPTPPAPPPATPTC